MRDKKKFDIVSQKISDLRAKRMDILRMEPEKALASILDDPESIALVHSIPEDDFFILMHEVGVNDFLPVLAMASDRQWQYILDTETWDGDRISVDSMAKWFDVLLRADAPRLCRWLMYTGIETSEYYLNRNIELIIREHDQDPSDFGDGFVSFDNVFYFRIRPPEYYGGSLTKEASQDRGLLIDSLLKGLASIDYPRFQSMLFESDALIASEFEEELYRKRTIRLYDNGFMPFEEAIGVYQPLAGWESYDTGMRQVVAPEDEPSLSLYPSILASGSGFFKDLPVSFDQMDLPEDFGNEMAAVCNRIIVSDHKTVRSREDLRQVVAKACGYITLGIGEISESSGKSPDSILPLYHLNYLFRAGYTRVSRLQKIARDWIGSSWFKREEIPLSFWGEEWMGSLGGLLLKRPLFFCNYESGLLYRDFRHEEDIEKTRLALDSMIVMDGVFSRMGISYSSFSEAGLSGILIKAVSFIMTLWANKWLGRSDAKEFFIPLTEFRRFYDAIIVDGEVPGEMKENFVDWLSFATKMELPEIFERIWFVFDGIFRDIQNEFKYIEPQNIDPRFIGFFYLSR